ncbi:MULTISPECIES: hypothetical protein [unclassified Streptomyces]|uniref:hypothetical protein n=1 Tax=unclassified Streptomyces TaxID=2593676 RepID=UPI0022B6D90C|nr:MULTISPECIES: hypothetical protein [unclassified Streptomyces]MCZ7414252.1 hypothetical protein [Streptomyces sp. WMMC897]MCZ7431270.1 hypothetical protein [Streptomyces sp. WMMC1477]
MTQPPSAQPALAPPTAPPAVPPQAGPPSGVAGPSAPAPGQPTGPARHTAWTENWRRLRAAATTEPGRLRVIGAVLVVLVLTFGLLTSLQVSTRASAADAVIGSSQPLSADAAEIHRLLADANTTAASGFLAGGEEPRAVGERYDDDIRQAAELITRAAASGEGSRTARQQLSTLNRELPVYTGLVEAARANNRQGLPIGGAYLRYADERMRTTLLPAARTLYETESARYQRDHDEATSWPWQALLLGVLVLGALGWAQRRHYLRTNRVFNRGLLGATATVLVVLGWLAVGHGTAWSRLGDAERDAGRSLQSLNESLVAALEARGDENMTLVARGAGASYEETYQESMLRLVGEGAQRPGRALLERAALLADDETGRAAVDEAMEQAREWKERHAEVRELDNSGEYADAVAKAIGTEESTGQAFDKVDAALREAIRHEQGQFTGAAESGRSALTGLAVGAGLLTLLGAAGSVAGIGRRLAEYR